jgi:hypothetical protein
MLHDLTANSWARQALFLPASRWVFLAALLLTGLPGCNTFARPTPLPFQTLAQSDFPSPANSKGRLEVAATPQEGDDLAFNFRAVYGPVSDQLRQLDYNHSFALLVVSDSVGSSGSHITVQEITRQGDQVTIRASFTGPPPNTNQLQSFMKPYHLVTVPKEGTWGQPVHFRVVTGDAVVAEATHMIP